VPVIWQPAKVATPELAASGLVVQPSVPDDEVSVIGADELVTTLPPESSTLTTGWVENAAPFVADDGEAVKTSWVAAPTPKLKLVEVVDVSPELVAPRV
jgi:hypothetical protein